MYDIIGDIHGHAEALWLLLAKLGYQKKGKSYYHPDNRQVIFLGDFVDRGSAIKETLQTARAMIDSGNALAVMGNLEFNLVSYITVKNTVPED